MQYFVSLSYKFVDKETVLKIWLNLSLNQEPVLRSPGLLMSRITLQARASLKGAYLGSTIIHVNLRDPKLYQLHSNHLLKNRTSHLCLQLGYGRPDGFPVH